MVMVKALDDPKDVARIIQKDNPELLDATALWLGEQLARADLTNSQIRNIFSTARQIEARRRLSKLSDQSEIDNNATRREFILLKPKLAYQAARMNDRGIGKLKDWLSAAIDAAITPDRDADEESDRFRRLMEFFEAILAYHYAIQKGQR